VDGPAVDRGAVVAAEIYGPPVTVAALKCGVMARDQWIVGQCNKIVCLSSDGYMRTHQFDRPDTTTRGIDLYPRHTASLTPAGHRDQVTRQGSRYGIVVTVTGCVPGSTGGTPLGTSRVPFHRYSMGRG